MNRDISGDPGRGVSRNMAILAQRLAAWLPEGERMTGLTPLTAGHSNETYIIEGLDAILRLPPASAPLLRAHDIITQAQIYREVGELDGAPPVPGVRHICTDALVLGDPFFVMDRVAGQAVHDYVLPEWFTALTDSERGSICAHWVAAIGAIASLPPLASLSEPVTPEQALRRWRAFAVEADCMPLAELIDRLLLIPAPRSGAAGPVHGDCKITNLMFDQLRVSAVLDWELGYNGEPLSDLGYMLYAFTSDYHGPTRTSSPPGMCTRAQVIRAWEQAAKRSASGLIWYEAAEIGKLAAIYAKGRALHSTGDSSDPRMLVFANKLDESLAIMEAMLPEVSATCG